MKLVRSILILLAHMSCIAYAQQLQLKWETPAAPYPSCTIKYVDLGSFRGFMLTDSTHIYFYDGSSHSLRWTLPKQGAEHPEVVTPETPIALDLNGNGTRDLLISGSSPGHSWLRIVDPSTGGQIALYDSEGTQFSPRSVADVDGDGKLEVLIQRNVSQLSGSDYSRISYLICSTNLSVTSAPGGSQSIPNQLQLGQNYPNPFNPSTTIPYELAVPGPILIRIYDIAGRLVRSISSPYQAAGSQTTVWDGNDSAGRMVSSGTYLYEVVSKDASQSKKMLLLK